MADGFRRDKGAKPSWAIEHELVETVEQFHAAIVVAACLVTAAALAAICALTGG